MEPIHYILVIVDPTAEQHPEVDKAALLAAKLDARLELFICDTKLSQQTRLAAHVRSHPDKPYVRSLKALLEPLAEPLRARGLDVTTETECADPLCAGLIDRTRRTTADLVIKNTHHHSIARRTFLTNTDWELIRGCPVPLLLTKSDPWASRPVVVAAVDPGHENDKPALLDHHILEHASCFARGLGGQLHVLHAYLPMAIVAAATAEPPMAVAVSAEDLAAERQAELDELQSLVAGYAVDPANIHAETGGPGELLPRVARNLHADIMVMGAISRRGVKRVFMGSTAEDVLEHLPCDALIIKSPGFAEPLSF